MKWTEEQEKRLRELYADGVSNAKIAEAFGVKVTEIYAKRSALGITIDKVRAEVYDEKRQFVAKYLKPLLCAAVPVIGEVIYTVTDGHEKVLISAIKGSADYVNVTGDSLITMCADVLKVIA